jgi:hypothetical protein
LPPQAGVTVTVPLDVRFVNNLYVTLLGRAAEQAGLAFWVVALHVGASRLQYKPSHRTQG